MTQIATGAASKVVMGFEPDFGTIPLAGFVMPVVKCALRRSRKKIDNPEISGNLNPGKPLNGNIDVSGQIVVLLDAITAWYWFKAMFNSYTKTGTAPGPFVHEFKMSGLAPRPSMTIEVQYLDLVEPKYFQYVGCKINSFSIATGDEGHVQLTMDVVGKNRTIAANSFDSAATDLSSAPLDNSHSTVKENDVAFTTSTSTSCNVSFNLDTSKRFVGGGGTVGVLPDSIINVSGKHDFVFQNTTLLDKATNSTKTSIEMDFTAAADKKVNILCPEVNFAEEDPGIDGPQGIAISLPWSGYYDNSAEAAAIVVKVTNAEEHV